MNTHTTSNGAPVSSFIADVKVSPELRREALVALARRGISEYRTVQGETLAQLHAINEAARSTADEVTLGGFVKRTNAQLRSLRTRVHAHLRAADTLLDLAAADGRTEPEFADLRTCMDSLATAMDALNERWTAERERLLRLAGLHGALNAVSYTRAVQTVRHVLAGETETVSTPTD